MRNQIDFATMQIVFRPSNTVMRMDSDNPFLNLDGDARESFHAAGWRPGVSRLSSNPSRWPPSFFRYFQTRHRHPKSACTQETLEQIERDFGMFPAARLVLAETCGLVVRALPRSGPFISHNLVFWPLELKHSEYYGLADHIRVLASALQVVLVPIAEIGSAGIVLLADSGHLLTISIVAKYVFLDGKTFAEGVGRILRGMRPRQVYLPPARDPRGDFNDPFDPITHASPHVLIPTLERGIHGVDCNMPDT